MNHLWGALQSSSNTQLSPHNTCDKFSNSIASQTRRKRSKQLEKDSRKDTHTQTHTQTRLSILLGHRLPDCPPHTDTPLHPARTQAPGLSSTHRHASPSCSDTGSRTVHTQTRLSILLGHRLPDFPPPSVPVCSLTSHHLLDEPSGHPLAE